MTIEKKILVSQATQKNGWRERVGREDGEGGREEGGRGAREGREEGGEWREEGIGGEGGRGGMKTGRKRSIWKMGADGRATSSLLVNFLITCPFGSGENVVTPIETPPAQAFNLGHEM